ncbi:MAG: nucleotidyltransferase family protein [Desulfobacula sp.]|jgi:hypothetical protein|nr:nucleotidyltransferase family protein [Desulfobacula sp.]
MEDTHHKNLSKEIELVLLCSNVKVDERDLERIKYLSAKNIDWGFFKALIIQNRTYVIGYQNLKLLKENVPEILMSELKELAISTGIKNLFFTIFLQKLVEAFKEQDIFMLPFKGPALAEQIYGDIIFRPFSDLDILVDKSNAVQAFNLLKKQGLTAQFVLKDSQFKKYINDEDHFSFYDPKRKITVELHWELSGLYLSLPIETSDLKAHITTGVINSTKIPCLSPEALLVYLCVHGSKHGWEHLEQVCCLAELIKLNKNLDWKKINKISADWQCKKMLSLGLYLAIKLLKAPVPDAILLEVESRDTVLEIANEVNNNLFNLLSDKDKKGISDRFSSFHIRIRDSYVDKIRYALRLLFRPTDKEWLYYPVPASVSFLHYFLRPYRLTIAKFRGKHA